MVRTESSLRMAPELFAQANPEGMFTDMLGPYVFFELM